MCSCLPEATSHSLTTLSQPPVASVLPSGKNATEYVPYPCPGFLLTCPAASRGSLPVAKSQRLGVALLKPDCERRI